MSKSKYSKQIFIIILLLFCRNLNAQYVDLEEYKHYVYRPQNSTIFDNILKKGEEALGSAANDATVVNLLEGNKFWQLVSMSLQTNTMPFNLANHRFDENSTGADMMLSTVFSMVRQIPVKYRSVDANGDSITLSGKIFIPKQGRIKNLVLASHYTVCSSAEVPSNAFSIEGIYATKGYIVVMSDYIGYGISEQRIHPYLHLKTEISSQLDLLQAAIPYLHSLGLDFDERLILLGYSQGGGLTLALQREIETNRYEFRIKSVYAGAGPYNIATTYDIYASNDSTAIPCAVPMLFNGINEAEKLELDMNMLFTPFLQTLYPEYIGSKKKTMYEVGDAFGYKLSRLLQPIALCKDSVPTDRFYEALQRNTVQPFSPVAPLYLFHSRNDDMVPFENSLYVQQFMQDRNADNVRYDFGDYGIHMQAALVFFKNVYLNL